MSLTLDTPVSQISRVGQATAGRLKKLEIETVRDLIFYYPWRWEDLSRIVTIAEAEPSSLVTIKGVVTSIKNHRSYGRSRSLTEAVVADTTGDLKVIWFNQSFIAKTLQEDEEIYLSGKVSFDKYGLKQMISPVYEKSKASTTHTARIVPIDPLTSNITQKQLRFLIKEVIYLSDTVTDFLPSEVAASHNLLGLSQSLRQLHFPDSPDLLARAIARLKFDELFLFQLQILLSRKEINQSRAPSLKFYELETKQLVNSLPFKLTADQKKAAWQILSDIQKTRPMNRLLEGDVGSGKTIVSALVMLNVLLNNHQSVLMAPTEILAAQHYRNISAVLEKYQSRIGLVTRSQKFIGFKNKTQSAMLSAIKKGELQIIIGTHSLIQEDVKFKNLSLVVIDEQHRFGVKQRQFLRKNSGKSSLTPHLLSMTATPIPRSLALVLYGDLDVSIIKEMPQSRKRIITQVIDSKNRSVAYDFIKKEITKGHQIFVVCPLIDPSDKLGVKSVTSEFDKLRKEIFPDLAISMIHGKLKSAEKEKVMADFVANKSSVLVSTAVIEVGVDIPNATVMIIEDADRFGLAQLHQFRGRVGRSYHQSYCFLFSSNSKAEKRLKMLEKVTDGFKLAEIDLQNRGPGSIYGQMQSGWPEFKIAKPNDFDLISQAKKAAETVLAKSPELQDFPLLKQKMAGFLSDLHPE